MLRWVRRVDRDEELQGLVSWETFQLCHQLALLLQLLFDDASARLIHWILGKCFLEFQLIFGRRQQLPNDCAGRPCPIASSTEQSVVFLVCRKRLGSSLSGRP